MTVIPHFCTVHDILHYCAPPITLIEWLEKHEARQALPEDVQDYLNKWRTLRSDRPSILDGIQLHEASTM